MLAPWLFLYGTRRLTVSILVGLVLATGLGYLRSELVSEMLIWAGLGYIVPGLIAHQWYRQGFLPTAIALAIAAPLTRAWRCSPRCRAAMMGVDIVRRGSASATGDG